MTNLPIPDGGRLGADAADDRAVVITGICGRLGRRLTRALHREVKVIGLDRRAFPDRPRDIEHHEIDIRSKRTKDVFRSGNVRALVHLGVMHNPRDSIEDHHSWNVVAFQHLLEYAERYKVPKVVELAAALPREDSGKIFKRKLLTPYWEKAGRSI